MNLDLLSTDDYMTKLWCSSYGSLRWSVRNTEEYLDLEAAYYADEVTDQQIENYVNGLIRSDFKTGRKFPFEGTLVAFLLLYRNFRSEFGDKYIETLASFDSSELVLACGIARQISDEISPRPSTQST